MSSIAPAPLASQIDKPTATPEAIEAEKLRAYTNPKKFFEEIRSIQEIIEGQVLPLSYKLNLCRYTPCRKGYNCRFAHKEVVRYAVNLLENPAFKHKPCHFGDSCKKPHTCDFVHPGELLLLRNKKVVIYQPSSRSAPNSERFQQEISRPLSEPARSSDPIQPPIPRPVSQQSLRELPQEEWDEFSRLRKSPDELMAELQAPHPHQLTNLLLQEFGSQTGLAASLQEELNALGRPRRSPVELMEKLANPDTLE